MRRAPKTRGFSIIELMIALVLLTGVTISAMTVMNKLQRKERESSLVTEYALVGAQLDSQFAYDLKNAAKIDGPYTNAGTQFDSTKTYGILRAPFQSEGSDVSDGIQIFVTDPGLSQTASFDIASISGNQMTVNGDFTPTVALAEDLFVAVVNNKKELFKVSGTIQVTGTSPSQVSTFTVANCDSNLAAAITSAIASNPPQIYRVQRVTYQIGNGAGITRGIYRTVNGSTAKIASDVASMQIRYELATTDAAKSADCALSTKNDSRWFAHATSASECSWNEIASIHVEVVFESPTDMGAPVNFNPHIPGVSDGKVRYTMHISKVPTSYTTSS